MPTVFDKISQSSSIQYQVPNSYNYQQNQFQTNQSVSTTQNNNNNSSFKNQSKSYSKLANTLSNPSVDQLNSNNNNRSSTSELKFQKITAASTSEQQQQQSFGSIAANELIRNDNLTQQEKKSYYKSMSNLSNLFKYEKSFQSDPDRFFAMKDEILPFTSSPLITMKQLEELKYVRKGNPNNFYMQMIRQTKLDKRNPQYETSIPNIQQRQTIYQHHMNQSAPKLAAPLLPQTGSIIAGSSTNNNSSKINVTNNNNASSILNNNQNNSSANPINKKKKRNSKTKSTQRLITENGQELFLNQEEVEDEQQQGNKSPNSQQLKHKIEKQLNIHKSQNLTLQKSNERSDIVQLAKWLDEMLLELKKQNKWNFKEFYESLETIYTGCISEIVRQIAVHCFDRGQLLEQVWLSFLKTVKEFFDQMQQSTMGVEMEGLVENKRLHRLYRHELDRIYSQVENLNEKVEMRDNYVGKVRNENRYFKKKIKRLDKYITVLNSDFNEQIKKYEMAQEEIKQLKLERQDFEQKIAELEQKLEYMENQQLLLSGNFNDAVSNYNIQTPSSQQQQNNNNNRKSLINNLQETQQQIQSSYNMTVNYFGDIENIKAQLKQQFQEIFEEEKKRIIENYQALDEQKKKLQMAKEQADIEDKFEYQDDEKEQLVQNLVEIEEFTLENKETDTNGLLYSVNIACDTSGLLQKSECQVQTEKFFNTKNQAIQVAVTKETRSTQVSLNLIMQEKKSQRLELLRRMQKGLKVFLDEIGGFNFPLKLAAELNEGTLDIFSNELTFLKSKVKDAMLGLLIKEDINTQDFDAVSHYVEVNYDAIYELVNTIWVNIDKLFKNGVDFKIEAIEKGLDEQIATDSLNKNQKILKKLYDSYKSLKGNTTAQISLQPQIKLNLAGSKKKMSTLQPDLIGIADKSATGTLQKVGKKIMNAMIFKGTKSPSNQQQQSNAQNTSFQQKASEVQNLLNPSNNSQINLNNSYTQLNTNQDIKLQQQQLNSNSNTSLQQINSQANIEEDQEIENVINQRMQKQQQEESKLQKNKNQHSKKQSQLSNLTISEQIKEQDEDEANTFIKEKKEDSDQDKADLLEKTKQRHKSLQQIDQVILDNNNNQSDKQNTPSKNEFRQRRSLPDNYKFSFQVQKDQSKNSSKNQSQVNIAIPFQRSKVKKRSKRVSVIYNVPRELTQQIANISKDYQKQIELENKQQEQKLNLNNISFDSDNQDDVQQFLLEQNMTAQPIQSINARFRTHKSTNNYTSQATEQLQKSLDEYKKKINVIHYQLTTFLKMNSQLFTDILKMLAFNENSKPPLFYISLYEFIISTFGITLSSMKKFQKFIVSCLFYANQSKRAEMYSKLISGYYDHVDYQFILESMQLLDDTNQKGITMLQSYDDHILVNYNKSIEVLYNQFNESYERKKLSQIERSLHSKIVKHQNRLLIDLDIVLEQYMQLFKEVRNRMNNVYKDIFYAVDIDMTNVISYEDFILLMRHIESYRFDLNKLNMYKLFQLECDYQIEKKKYMSIQRFSALCIDNELFDFNVQDQFLKGDGEYCLQKLKPEWINIRRFMKLRLIKSNQYTIKLRKLITKIDNYMDGDNKFGRRNYIIYLLLEAESKRILIEHFSKELISDKLNDLFIKTEEVLISKKLKI